MKKKVNVRDLSLMALFAALTAVGAFITIPVPPVPFSLQIFFAILAGALLGSRQGAMSIVIYLLLGLCGLPVFTKGAGRPLVICWDLFRQHGCAEKSSKLEKAAAFGRCWWLVFRQRVWILPSGADTMR